jgi:hypothetical protein
MTDHRHRWHFQTAQSLLKPGIKGILACREEKPDKYSAVHARRCDMMVKIVFGETEFDSDLSTPRNSACQTEM